MTDIPEISIITPAFNREEYLVACIESILSQTFIDFELILVDDGSTDKSAMICEDYAAKDSRVIVIHQKNKGVSAARNTGLDISRGKYIGWVDSDDWIAPDMFEHLISLIKEFKADIAECRYYYLINDKKRLDGHGFGIETGQEYYLIDRYIKGMLSESLCTKLTNRRLFDNFRFPEGQVFEDMRCILYMCLQLPVYVSSDLPKYFYRQTENSIMTANFSRKTAKTSIYLLQDQLKIIQNSHMVELQFKYKLRKAVIEDHLGRYLAMKLSSDNIIRRKYSKIYKQYFRYNLTDCITSTNHNTRIKFIYLMDKLGAIGIYKCLF